MRSKLLVATALTAFGVGALSFAHADPCGMVPPMIMVDGNVPIERVGAQKTYVFHKDGVETMVLRPGFKGKVDQFGMLIPFPSPPSLRKVNDNIFPHIAAAIDPPEVIAWVNRRRRWRGRRAPMSKASGRSATADSAAPKLSFNQVKVVNQEAVGMYEVAVLAAGSAQALQKWMNRHGYKYPKGMDKVTNDYVKIGWYFVAVKTRVGQKGGVNPRPGMRKVNSKLPTGATFNGFVQAMGFRFKSKELVVPMRLSAFNKGKLRNIVYILSDGPRRIKHIPRRYVVRQLTGKELYRNVTKPLPLRVMGGTFKQLNSWQKTQLKARRNPAPFNALAKELFASDLMAVRKHRLSNPNEEIEKNLLSIGERLNMRGAKVDLLHAKVLKTSRNRAVTVALKQLKRMTLTVVDGEFLRATIAKENLTFAWYRMSHRRNKRQFYDSRLKGPAVRRGGKVYHGSLLDIEKQINGMPGMTTSAQTNVASARSIWNSNLPKGLGLGCGVFLLGFVMRRRISRIGGMALIVAVSVSATMFGAGFASAEQARVTGPSDYIKLLKHKKRASGAVNTLVRFYGKRAVDDLLDEVVDGNDLGSRGWAIVALAEIGGKRADAGLAKIHANTAESALVRAWAVSARIKMAKSMAELIKFNAFRWSMPATVRPLGKRMVALLGNTRDAEKLLMAAVRMPQLRPQLNGAVMNLGARKLIRAMMTSKNNQVRRWAASYLGGMARTPKQRVAERFLHAVRYRNATKNAPWHGGALFVPGVKWTKSQARRLTARLIRWHLWAEIKGNNTIKTQVHNNLRQWQLARAAGYKMPSWRQRSSADWLRSWGKVVGKRRIRSLLWQVGAMRLPKYRAVLRTL